jgi:cyclopropane fatty-acyl-phospholipid synthase-like methyltransferase
MLGQMKSTAANLHIQSNKKLKVIQDYYDGATQDYAYWSKNMFMHYGYSKHIFDVFNREKLLAQLNDEVAKRLLTSSFINHRWADFGSGAGAVARYMNRKFKVKVDAINVVASQQKTALANTPYDQKSEVNYITGDYHLQQIPEESVTGAYAMESACHAYSKKALVRQFYTALKPGGKLVIADCYAKKDIQKRTWLEKWCVKSFERDWGVPPLWNIHNYTALLEKQGFKNVKAEHISHRVLPSVMHSPWVTLKFWLKHLFSLKPQSAANLKGVIAAIGIGIHLRRYGYYLVSAEK